MYVMLLVVPRRDVIERLPLKSTEVRPQMDVIYIEELCQSEGRLGMT